MVIGPHVTYTYKHTQDTHVLNLPKQQQVYH